NCQRPPATGHRPTASADRGRGPAQIADDEPEDTGATHCHVVLAALVEPRAADGVPAAVLALALHLRERAVRRGPDAAVEPRRLARVEGAREEAHPLAGECGGGRDAAARRGGGGGRLRGRLARLGLG